jgi:membrane-associated protease RseP (regulator of RpoE activity)
MKHPKRAVAGAVRWWTPLLWLAVGTAGLVFAAWAGGVDMHAVGERIADRLGKVLPPEDVVLEDRDYITITSLHYDDGELMYWRLPMNWNDEVREQVRNPRWRLLMRVHPRAEGEPPGLRVARIGEKGAAARADVRVGDVIVGVEEQRPSTSAELEAALQLAITERAPGGVLALLIERGGAEQIVRVELQPLLSKAEWDSLPEEDLEERWMFYSQPWRREHRDRDQRKEREAQATQTPAADPGATEVSVPTEAPPLPPENPN